MAERQFHGIRARSAIDAFSIAAANGKIREMGLLLADGVDVNGIAAYCGGTALAAAAGYGLIRPVHFLIEAGADLNIRDRNDLTPLMSACSLGKSKGSQVALRLIEAGADVKYVRDDEMTALKFAVKRCQPEVIQALIEHGAEVDGPAGTDQTALMLAARSNNVEALKVLVKNGAMVSLKCKLPWAENRTAAGLAELEKRRPALKYLQGLCPRPKYPVSIDPAWLRWHNRTIPKLAKKIHDSRDFAAMPILADALEEAGCTNADILDHCRGPGPHVRGCFVVDLILGKE
jgi:hypothetical protein